MVVGWLGAAGPPGGAGPPNMLDTKGPASHGVAIVWWILFAFAAFVFLSMVLLVIGALRSGVGREDDESSPGDADESRPLGASADRFIGVGGVIIPLAILIVVGVVTVHASTAIWRVSPRPVRIEVTAADWYWAVVEPGGVRTANEIPVPVGRPVEIGLSSRDVIHSMWVPQLAPKVDVIPGQHNVLRFTAQQTGTFRGQCAEFCGLQHAHMIFFVVAMPGRDYDAWLAHHRRAPTPPKGAQAVEGRRQFETQSCAGCHTIKATSAQGTLGPDLTYFGSRRTIGAGTVANTPDNLAAWITDSQKVKPGNRMPPARLSAEQVRALVAYLESQR